MKWCSISRIIAVCLSVILLVAANAAGAEPAVAATIETTLSTGGDHIRQFAFDGDAGTWFASAKNPTKQDHFTLVFDKPVAVKSLSVALADPKGDKVFGAVSVLVSEDGKKFNSAARFVHGLAEAQFKGQKVQAVRVQPVDDMSRPLAIREFTIQSDPPVLIFKYPVEFTVRTPDAPDMKEWAEKSARICERQYRMINEELESDRFKPATTVTMTVTNDYQGVAGASGDRITGSAKYFKDHPDDFGAMVHETVHVVQDYRTGNNPGWLVEGIADYVRFFKYEPGKIGRIRGNYDGAYRESAAFLAYVSEKYDKQIVKKLNKAMREGEYREEIWKTLTRKTVQQLGEEWKMSLEGK